MQSEYECKPLTLKEIKALEEKLFGPGGELRDLAHLRGIRAVYEPKTDEEREEFRYKGDIKF